MKDLDYLLAQIRRLEENREKGAEKQIREAYQEILKDLRHYVADKYSLYAEDDRLSYDILQKHGYYARFLDEVAEKMDGITLKTRHLIRSTVEQTYEATYNGLIECVKKAASGLDMGSLNGCTHDVMKRAVENPISKLTLNDRLEKHRKDIVYDVKQHISVGLMNGDRYSTMANRIKQSLEEDYKKAVRIVRTETHRVREAGNQDAALSVAEVTKSENCKMQMMKTWKTMADERVRPSGKIKSRKYDHRKMNGVTIPADEEFNLPSGTKTMAPGQSGVAGEDINCRCYLSYSLQKAPNGLAAERGGYGLPEHPEPQKIESIDFSNKKLIQSKIEGYENQIVSEQIENAFVITRKGDVFRCIGTQNQVFPNADLGNRMRGAYITHNHPISETHFSFSADDLVLFMEYKLPELRGIDSLYTYRLTRLHSTKDLDRDATAHLFQVDYYHQVMEKAFMGEIDMEVDEYHEIVKLFAQECGFRYERWQT